MDNTKKFVELAKKMYEFDKDNPTAENDWFEMILSFSNGICGMCHRPLVVDKIKTNFQGTEYYFQCGHMFKMMKIDDKTTKVRDSNLIFNRATISLDSKALMVKATHSGKKIKTDHDELGVARKFIEIAYPDFQKITKNKEEASLTDILAINEKNGEKLFIQITKLYPSEFWKEFNVNKKTETEQEVKPLILGAIERKLNFDEDEKKKTILLIDSWPGFNKETLGELSDEFKLKLLNSKYKEIWLVGALKELTFRLI